MLMASRWSLAWCTREQSLSKAVLMHTAISRLHSWMAFPQDDSIQFLDIVVEGGR